jgi:hypothetical protein
LGRVTRDCESATAASAVVLMLNLPLVLQTLGVPLPSLAKEQVMRAIRFEAFGDPAVLDTENAVIHHQLEQQLFPGTYPDDLKRKYRFFDDKPLLEPLDEKDHKILWQRATA